MGMIADEWRAEVSNYGRCSICREYAFLDRHRCPPIWEARIHETKFEEDWSEVYADSADSAAAKFAEEYDAGGDYTIIRRGSAEVEVRKPGETEFIIFDIQAESMPQYSAWARS